MASTAHSDPEMMKEHRDPPEVLAQKVDELAALVKKSNHFVVFTGAGISTSAGIPDFRGPNGKWTREAAGKRPLSGVSTVKAFPTPTHMSLVALHVRGMLKYVISQNCDGLHRRSGLPGSAISELHGNGNVEVCEDCGQRYFRDFQAHRKPWGCDHFTGRFCGRCQGALLESTIDFGQSLPKEPLDKAVEESTKADLHLVLGSSLTVSPANEMPQITAAKKGGKMVICNLQKTPLTKSAAFQIFAETDTVMRMLMERLHVPIPPFRLLRRVLFGVSRSTTEKPVTGRTADVAGGGAAGAGGTSRVSVFTKAVDVHDPTLDLGLIWAVDWDDEKEGIAGSLAGKEDGGARASTEKHQRAAALVATGQGFHSRTLDIPPKADGTMQSSDLAHLRPTLHFIGHYLEPPVQVEVDLSSANTQGFADLLLCFDPYELTWRTLDPVEAIEAVGDTYKVLKNVGGTKRDAFTSDSRFGQDHRSYCVKQLMKAKKELSRAQAEEITDRYMQESRQNSLKSSRAQELARRLREGAALQVA